MRAPKRPDWQSAAVQNRINGAQFERFLEKECKQQSVLFIKMPLGMRRLPGARIMPVKTPFDYTLIFKGEAVFIDCKYFQGNTLDHSRLTDHQVQSLSVIKENGCEAGYLVCFCDHDAVVFYNALQLLNLKIQESLKIDEGVYLGTLTDFCLGNLFKGDLKKWPFQNYSNQDRQ